MSCFNGDTIPYLFTFTRDESLAYSASVLTFRKVERIKSFGARSPFKREVLITTPSKFLPLSRSFQSFRSEPFCIQGVFSGIHEEALT